MKYSQMTPEQRKELLDNPENYPLRVAFLGKVALLTLPEVAFLQRNGVDFDVDDRQVAEILGEQAGAGEAPSPGETIEGAIPPAERPRHRLPWLGFLTALVGILAAGLRALGRFLRL